METKSAGMSKMWKDNHPFKLDECIPYADTSELQREHDSSFKRYYDEPYTWGKSPYKFKSDIRYKFNDDKGEGECISWLQNVKKNYRDHKERKRTISTNGSRDSSPGRDVEIYDQNIHINRGNPTDFEDGSENDF